MIPFFKKSTLTQKILYDRKINISDFISTSVSMIITIYERGPFGLLGPLEPLGLFYSKLFLRAHEPLGT